MDGLTEWEREVWAVYRWRLRLSPVGPPPPPPAGPPRQWRLGPTLEAGRLIERKVWAAARAVEAGKWERQRICPLWTSEDEQRLAAALAQIEVAGEAASTEGEAARSELLNNRGMGKADAQGDGTGVTGPGGGGEKAYGPEAVFVEARALHRACQAVLREVAEGAIDAVAGERALLGCLAAASPEAVAAAQRLFGLEPASLRELLATA